VKENMDAKMLRPISSQGSGVASPKIWGGGKNFVVGQIVILKVNNTVSFRKTPLKAQNDYIF